MFVNIVLIYVLEHYNSTWNVYKREMLYDLLTLRMFLEVSELARWYSRRSVMIPTRRGSR